MLTHEPPGTSADTLLCCAIVRYVMCCAVTDGFVMGCILEAAVKPKFLQGAPGGLLPRNQQADAGRHVC